MFIKEVIQIWFPEVNLDPFPISSCIQRALVKMNYYVSIQITVYYNIFNFQDIVFEDI